MATAATVPRPGIAARPAAHWPWNPLGEDPPAARGASFPVTASGPAEPQTFLQVQDLMIVQSYICPATIRSDKVGLNIDSEHVLEAPATLIACSGCPISPACTRMSTQQRRTRRAIVVRVRERGRGEKAQKEGGRERESEYKHARPKQAQALVQAGDPAACAFRVRPPARPES